jgi:hypothetical protein
MSVTPSSEPKAARPAIWSIGALVNVLLWCAVVAVGVFWYVLWPLDGLGYYTTPLGVRFYHAAHPMLKPSGDVAHVMGAVGALMILMPVAYSVRKHWKRLSRWGSLKTWLEAHVFCGIVGPMLVTVHTAMRFGGIVAVAYWSMMLVVLSGFVGRYFFVRIPKTIRGVELGYDEILERATDLRMRLFEAKLPDPLLRALDAFERTVAPDPSKLSVRGYLFGQVSLRSAVRRLRRDLAAAGADDHLAARLVAIEFEREMLLGRLAYLEKSKQMFGAWHVFHQPLVFVTLAIVAVHVGVAIYFGYTIISLGRE